MSIAASITLVIVALAIGLVVGYTQGHRQGYIEGWDGCADVQHRAHKLRGLKAAATRRNKVRV